MEIIPGSPADRLDFGRAVRLNRSFVPDDLHKQEADILFSVPFREGEGEVWVYVLIEHQSRPDAAMGLRFLSYMVQLWDMERREWRAANRKTPLRLNPIIPVLFYTGGRRWARLPGVDALMDLPEPLRRFVPQFETLFLSVRDAPDDVLTRSPLGSVLRVLSAADGSITALERVMRKVMTVLGDLPEERHDEWARLMHFLVLLIRHKREPEERVTLYNIVREVVDERRRPEVEKMGMTDAQVLVAQGKREGKREGRQEGQRETRIEMLLELLEVKFGAVPENLGARIASMPDRELRDASRRLLTASTLDEMGL